MPVLLVRINANCAVVPRLPDKIGNVWFRIVELFNLLLSYSSKLVLSYIPVTIFLPEPMFTNPLKPE